MRIVAANETYKRLQCRYHTITIHSTLQYAACKSQAFSSAQNCRVQYTNKMAFGGPPPPMFVGPPPPDSLPPSPGDPRYEHLVEHSLYFPGDDRYPDFNPPRPPLPPTCGRFPPRRFSPKPHHSSKSRRSSGGRRRKTTVYNDGSDSDASEAHSPENHGSSKQKKVRYSKKESSGCCIVQ